MNTAFWSFTINNYTPTDLALVQQGYPDQVRQIVYTLERGEEKGTPHIQGYLRLHRQQRESFVRKLYPRAAFKGIASDEYNVNAQRYAQKLDHTAESPATITNNPFPDPVVELVSVIEEAFRRPDLNEYHHANPQSWEGGQPDNTTLLQWLTQVEFDRVRRSPRLAKFYVSPMYRNVKKDYLHALKAHVFDLQKNNEQIQFNVSTELEVTVPVFDPQNTDTHTHTHTHVQPAEEFSNELDIDNADEDEEEDDDEEAEDDSQASGTEHEGDYSDCEEDTDEDCGDEIRI